MIPLLFLAGLALFQVVVMGPIALDSGQILHLESRTTLSPEQSYDQLALQRVVLVGESHDDLHHHQVQLQVIQALHQRREQIAIGLEMIPQHLQPQLDRWVRGELEEGDFLDAISWYSTWGFDAELYLPIFRFAQQHRTPLVALNIKREVVHQVRMKGLQGVEEEVRRQIPPLAPASTDYRIRLSEVFNSHPMMSRMGKFEQFIQAQQVWDAVMATRIAQWLENNPQGLMIGLAGSGHLIYGHGIPHQLQSLHIQKVVTLLPWTVGEEWIDPSMAQYAWGVSKPPPKPEPVRLGVFLEERDQEKGGGVFIEKVMEDSLATKVGLQVGDRITRLNDQPIQSRHTLVRLIRQLEWGGSASVTVRRAGEEKVIPVALTP
ncbi:MAG: ChaN family lipoprotein [Magnetococcales bacterium]|nr:ChaN family lipoprotein [Magnetococcales bacterium]